MTLIDLFFNCVILYVLGSLLRLFPEHTVEYLKMAGLLYLIKTALWLALRIPLMLPIDRWERRGSPCDDNDPALVRAIYYFPFDFTLFYGALLGAFYAALVFWLAHGPLRMGEEILIPGLMLAGSICAGAIAVGVPVNLILTAKFSRRLAERKASAFHLIPGKQLSLGAKMATIALALGCAPSLLLFSVQRFVQDQGLYEEALRTASAVMRGLAREEPSRFHHWVLSERANPFLVKDGQIRFFGTTAPTPEMVSLLTESAPQEATLERVERQQRYVVALRRRDGGGAHGVIVGVPDPPNHWLAMSMVILLACFWPLFTATLLVRTIVVPISFVASTFHRIIGRGRTEETDRVPIFYKDEVGRLAFNANRTIDILTEARQQLEDTAETLALKNHELEQAYRTKGEFLANMSHELRTPLNAIIGFSRLVSRKLGDTIPDRQRRNLGLIEQSGEQLLSLVNDLLDFEKIEAGKLTVRRQTVEIAPLLEGLKSTLGPLAAERGLRLVVEMAELPESFPSDRERLRQILSNLLTNAIKYSDRGTVTLTGSREGEDVLFRVRDQGIGMTSEQLEKIFDPFHQVDATETRERGGVGLGLAIVGRLVKLLQGTISVQSKVGEGSEFEVRLPRVSTDGATAEENFDEPARLLLADRVASLGAGGLAIVEDDPHTTQLLEQVFAEASVSVRSFATEEEALGAFKERLPAVLVLDLTLAKGDGWSLLKKLRAETQGAEVAVLVYSAVELQEVELDRLKALRAIVVPKQGRDSLSRLLDAITTVSHRPPTL